MKTIGAVMEVPSMRAEIAAKPSRTTASTTSCQCIGGASQNGAMTGTRAAAVDLYWLPLGAGGQSVRLNGLVFERIASFSSRRSPLDLYHSALEVRLGAARFVVEMAPAWGGPPGPRGVVAQGAVGAALAAGIRLFRYEVRCWAGGVIPDAQEAVESPRRLTSDPESARRLLELVPRVPVPVWGRDELGAGEMWNSNSVVSWVLESAGLDAPTIELPSGGRAPGWDAGIAVARRS